MVGRNDELGIRRKRGVLECIKYEVWIFFFQAEDGIRDHCVTGVQTCALPIYRKLGEGGWRVH